MRRRAILMFVAAVVYTGAQMPVLNAATIIVTSSADSGPNTLRAAITAANSNDTIAFALNLPATITLTTGELLITNNLTISGPGSSSLTISGNNSGRVFNIGTSNTVTISGVRIADGVAGAGGVGAGIYVNTATLTLINCAVHNNHASGGSTASGGGIYSNQTQLTVNGCTVDSNTATGNGGGIYTTGSSLTIDRSVITANSAVIGGGAFNGAGTVTITNSLANTNTATHGGGVANVGTLGPATLNLNNCTFSSNTVSGTSATGSQIYNSRQLTTTSGNIANTTIVSDNVAAGFSGGAVYNNNGASLTIGNSILDATAQEHTIINSGTSTFTSAGSNLALDNGAGLLTALGDQINTNPLLDPSGLKDNGGATFTFALQGTSPAVDRGQRDTIAALAAGADQRGEPRPYNLRFLPGPPGDRSDIGSYEADFRLTNLNRAASDLQFNFTTVIGRSYQLQSRSSLSTGDWASFGNMAAGNGGIMSLTATNALAPARQFFQVLQSQ